MLSWMRRRRDGEGPDKAEGRELRYQVGGGAYSALAVWRPRAGFRIQFFAGETGFSPDVLKEVEVPAQDLSGAILEAAYVTRPPDAIGFVVLDREGRAVFGRRRADRW